MKTWASEDVLDTELALEGYNMDRKDRQGRMGDGAILYVNEKLKVMMISKIDAGVQESVMVSLVCIGGETRADSSCREEVPARAASYRRTYSTSWWSCSCDSCWKDTQVGSLSEADG